MRSRHLHPLLLFLPILISALTNREKKLIVEKHNSYRSQTDPPATDMRTLSWDSSLEELATSYAAKCIWEHNENRGFRGENLFLMSGSRLDVDMGLADWFKERDYYNFTANTCQEGQMCGHYTQMIWAGTERVGCGEKFCETVEGFEDGNMYLLVCNYEPPGNYQGQKPYMPGAPCSTCPETYSCKGSLCVDVDTEQMEGSTDFPGTTSELAPVTVSELAPYTTYTIQLAPYTIQMAPDTTPGMEPDTIQMAPDTIQMAPDTTPGMEPDTIQMAPDTIQMAPDTIQMAPDTIQLAPDTTPGMAPDTIQMAPDTIQMAPDTSLQLIEEKQLEMTSYRTTVLEADITTTKTESDTTTLLPTKSLSLVPDSSPAVPTTPSEQILDLSPSSPGGSSPQIPQDSSPQIALGTTDDSSSVSSATDIQHASLDEGTDHSQPTEKQKDNRTPEIQSYTEPPLTSTRSSGDYPASPKTDRSLESISTVTATHEHSSITVRSPLPPQTASDQTFSNDGPNTGEVHTLATNSRTKEHLDEDVSVLVDKNQPKDSPVQATPKSLLSPSKEKDKKKPYSDLRTPKKLIKEKEKSKQKSKFTFLPKKDQLKPKLFSKGVKWGYKSGYSEGSYFGNQVYTAPFGQAYRPFCPYPCLKPPSKFPLYRTNNASPWGGQYPKDSSTNKPTTRKPCKLFGYKSGIYGLYLPSKNKEENLTEPKS